MARFIFFAGLAFVAAFVDLAAVFFAGATFVLDFVALSPIFFEGEAFVTSLTDIASTFFAVALAAAFSLNSGHPLRKVAEKSH